MILIADSGSTKTDWALVKKGKTLLFQTQGLNPYHQDEESILEVLRTEVKPRMQGAIPHEIYFYGAGCNAEAAPRMQACLHEVFPKAEIEVESDLLGAARALCKNEPGIACILGTGSNSCVYDGEKIVKNIPPLGYILGDEGSGAALGRLFLNNIYKNSIYEEARKVFEEDSGLTYADVIDRVYRKPMANRFLASLAMFVSIYKEEYAELQDLIVQNFEDFFNKNVREYHLRLSLDVHCVGGLAYFFKRELLKAARLGNYHIGRILERPIDGLIEYHKGI